MTAANISHAISNTQNTNIRVYNRLSWLTLCSLQYCHKHTLRAFSDANFVIALEKPTEDVTSFSIDITAKPTSLSWVIVDRR